MPIYRYRCECGYEFEKLAHDVVKYRRCPECYGIAHNIIGKPANHFKGDNFTKGASNEQK